MNILSTNLSSDIYKPLLGRVSDAGSMFPDDCVNPVPNVSI